MTSYVELRKRRDKADLLAVVAYNAHKTALEATKYTLEEEGILNFRLYEYFADPPVWDKGKAEDSFIHAPFLRRIAEIESEMIPDVTNIEKIIDREYVSEEQKLSLCAPKSSDLLKKYFDVGVGGHFTKNVSEIGYKLFEEWWIKDRKEVPFLSCDTSKERLRKYFSEVLRNQEASKEDKIALLLEYFTSDHAYAYAEIEKVITLGLGIVSNKVFYGHIICYIPVSTKMLKREKMIRKNVERVLKEKGRDYFLPMLILFENYWEERTLSEKSADLRGDKIVLDEYEIPITFFHTEESNELFERRLHDVWKDRKREWERNQDWVKQSLLFRKFLVASPPMIDIMRRQVMWLDPKKTGGSEKLPTVLIIGGAGAGKDTIAKMIPLFSNDYRKERVYSINLASLKPPEIVPSLLMGLEIDVDKKQQEKSLSLCLEGIFEKIVEKELLMHGWEKGKIEKDVKAVIILDELNSLDIDTQGSLLRLVENADLIPIGGAKARNEKVKLGFLLIGEMNEDPERLTKESFLRDMIREGKSRSFGGMFGEILYEHFRKIRRLREDLYYRFIRGGKIVLPSLSERKEDIPILFYLFCRDELVKVRNHSNKRLYIPFEIFDLVSQLDWPGNVRHLQTFAPIVMRYANTDVQHNDENIIRVKKQHICSALREMGMEKPRICELLEREEEGQ